MGLFNQVLFVLIYQFLISKSHQCGYTITNISQIVTGINITVPSTGFIPRSVSATNLRIFFEYMDSFNNYPGAATLKSEVMEPARLSLQSAIMVNSPTNGVLRVDRQCITGQIMKNSNNEIGCVTDCAATTTCSSASVPNKYLNRCKVMTSSGNLEYSGTDGAGEPNVDIVLLVTATSCPNGVIAFANACFQESTLDRPIMGIVNICPGMMVAGIYNRVNIITVKHEIVHALGFAVDKFAFYRNPDGTPIVPRDQFGRPNLGITNGYYNWNEKIIVSVTRSRSSVSMTYTKTFYALVLPNIVAVAKEHFNCPSITEVELEDYGSIGSAYSHLDQYVIYNEFMNAENNGWNQRFSKFTLALLKDTGWYDVDYSKAEPLDYGRNAGCILPQKGCYAYMQAQKQAGNSIDPFCDVASGPILQCDSSRKYYQYCSVYEDSQRQPIYQYLTSVKGLTTSNPLFFGGRSPYSEYCPMKGVPANRYDGLSSDCTDLKNIGISNLFTPLDSSYGPIALCFDTTLVNQPIYGATCFNYSYDGNGINYKICVGGQTVTCNGNSVQYFMSSSGVPATINCIAPSLLSKNNFGTDFVCVSPTTSTTPKNSVSIRYSVTIHYVIFIMFAFK